MSDYILNINVEKLSPHPVNKTIYDFNSNQHQELKKKQKTAQFLSSLGSVISQAQSDAGKKTAHTSFNDGLSATTVIDDSDARRRAKREEEERLARMASIRNSMIQSENELLLKANTMSYGEMIGGSVIFKAQSPYGEKYNFRITIGSDIHKIIYEKE